MIRNLKALGLTLIAVLAISALAAAGAQAEAPEFHTEGEATSVKAEQVEQAVFTLTGGAVKCTTVTLEGTVGPTNIEVGGSYEGCKYAGQAVVWDMNGCKYSSTMVIGSSPPTTLTDLKCPAGKEITITNTSSGCVVHIPPQSDIPHVIWANAGSGSTRDLKNTITESGIKYTETSGCLFPGTYSNGVYKGSETYKAFNSKGVQIGLWVE
jgi:hypothetical protein